jgi:hypothetical protein
MQQDIASRGRKMVTIVDPHVKRDYSYYIHKEAAEKKYYVNKKDGSEFEGWCWPGKLLQPGGWRCLLGGGASVCLLGRCGLGAARVAELQHTTVLG